MSVDISCGFPPGPAVVDQVRNAEQLGYRRAWLYDSPALYPDVWMALARAADATTTIGLGTAVLVPSLRPVVTQAAAIATLAGLAPGRACVAIGTGFTGRMVLGQRPLSWAYVEGYVRQLRGLLRGETVEVDGKAVRLIHPDGFSPTRPIDVPVLVAANGPKGLAVARELGDGIMTVIAPQAGWEWCATLVFGTVLDPGEEPGSPRVVDAAGPAVGAMIHGMYESGTVDGIEGMPGGTEWRRAIEAVPAEERHLVLHEGHLVHVVERDRPLLEPGMLSALTWTDEAAGIKARLDAFEQSGGTEVLYAPSGPDIPRELEAFARAAGL